MDMLGVMNRKMVKMMFYDAFDAYLAHAFPSDELMPLSCRGTPANVKEHGQDGLYMGNWSRTLVDSLDMLYILGDWAEFEHAVHLAARSVMDAVKRDTDSDTAMTISLFETSIRVLGGLLSSHIIAANNTARFNPKAPYKGELLDAAEAVAQRLMPAFETPTGIPCISVSRNGTWNCVLNTTTVADAGSLLLEWHTLSRLTGKPIYSACAKRAMTALSLVRSPLGILSERISWSNLSTLFALQLLVLHHLFNCSCFLSPCLFEQWTWNSWTWH